MVPCDKQQQAAAKRGIPILLYEGGEALRFDKEAIQIGKEGILRVMEQLKMGDFAVEEIHSVEVEKTKWIRASQGGILRLKVSLEETVSKQQVSVKSPVNKLVIGPQNSLVNQGDGMIHLAIKKSA